MTTSHFLTTISLIAFSSGLSGCASLKGAMAHFQSGKVTSSADMSKTVYSEPPQIDVELFDTPQANIPSIVMPGQLKANPISIDFRHEPSRSGFQAVSYANRSAVIEPNSDNYLNAIQLYPYTPGSLYQVYTSPSQVTDIALERGEVLTSVSAGDTERWTVGDTVSGSGASEQLSLIHI